MQRRSLLRSLLATPPALLLAGCAVNPAPRRVVYASAFSLPKSTDEAIWLDFEARVERELPGHDVRLLIRGEAGPEESSFAAQRRGRIQLWDSYPTRHAPAAQCRQCGGGARAAQPR